MNNLKKQIDKELKDVHFTIDDLKFHQKISTGFSKPSWNRKQKCAAAAIAAIAACCSGTGIYAGVNYFQERGTQLSQEEKTAYIKDITNAPVDADTYSRALTKEERARRDKLMDRRICLDSRIQFQWYQSVIRSRWHGKK